MNPDSIFIVVVTLLGLCMLLLGLGLIQGVLVYSPAQSLACKNIGYDHQESYGRGQNICKSENKAVLVTFECSGLVHMSCKAIPISTEDILHAH